MLKTSKHLTLTERILVGLLALVIAVSTYQIGDKFWLTHSDPVPGTGGTFVEGVTGEFKFLNPVLAQTELDRDIVSLVSCGLTRFDPVSNTIIDDAADHTLSSDKRTYTFTLKENLVWQDGTPVTADDVIFTFRDVIQHADFPNPALAADFAGVQVTKLDERTATMTLDRKYAFFVYNTTIGLLPKHLLQDTPIGDLLASPYNLHPVGCGPYAVESVTGSQIRLAAFADYFRGRPLLDSVVFRIFTSEENLFKNLDGISGTKNLSPEHAKSLSKDARLALHQFTLPQYVGLFFNTERPILKNKKTRLGLQLATDKNQVLAAISDNGKIIDTPLLEIDTSDWKYEFDASRADGALYDAGWQYQVATQTPAKPVSTTPAPSASATQPTPAAPDPQVITQPTVQRFFATGESEFFVGGGAPAGASAIWVNGYKLSKYKSGDTSWSYKAAQSLQTLHSGENEYKVEAEIGGTRQEVDKLIVLYSSSEAERTAWLAGKEAGAKPTNPPVEAAPTATPTPTPDSNATTTAIAVGQKTPTKEANNPSDSQASSAPATTTPTAEGPKDTQAPDQPQSTTSKPTTTPAASSNPPAEPKNTKVRRNANGEKFALELIVPSDKTDFVKAAAVIKEMWAGRGVDLTVTELSDYKFLTRLNASEYDIALFGQNLGYNLDAYPFWHSSEARVNGSNLSNLKSSAVNAWLEQIRSSFDSSERRKRLANLREALAEEVPAVMLYTPLYHYAIDKNIQAFNLGRIALHRDRLAGLPGWYLRESRALKPDAGVWAFLKWFWQEL